MINIELFKKALESEIKSGKWASHTKEIFELGLELLSKEINGEMLSKAQENKITEVAIGTIITGIAAHKNKYPNDAIQGEFLAWSELYVACEMGAFNAELEKTIKNPSQRMEMISTQMIRESGARILRIDLSFDKQNLTARFPQLENFFHIIDIMRNGQYRKIEDEFDKALKHWESHGSELTDAQEKYMETVEQLKKHVLEQFKAGTKEFNYQNCLTLAYNTEKLTNNLMNNQLTEEKLKEYQRGNKVLFKENSNTKTLHLLLAALVFAAAVVAGMLIGMAVAGPAGASYGIAAGLVVGAGAAVAALQIHGIYARKNNPLAQLEDAAAEVVHNTPAGFDL